MNSDQVNLERPIEKQGSYRQHRLRAIAVVTGILWGISGMAMNGFAGHKPAIPFSRDLQGTLSRAEASRRPVIVMFHAVWCPYCRGMRETTLADPKVVEALIKGRG